MVEYMLNLNLKEGIKHKLALDSRRGEALENGLLISLFKGYELFGFNLQIFNQEEESLMSSLIMLSLESVEFLRDGVKQDFSYQIALKNNHLYIFNARNLEKMLERMEQFK
jgi:hypothetical protein